MLIRQILFYSQNTNREAIMCCKIREVLNASVMLKKDGYFFKELKLSLYLKCDLSFHLNFFTQKKNKTIRIFKHNTFFFVSPIRSIVNSTKEKVAPRFLRNRCDGK